MSGEATLPSGAAAMVAASASPSEGSLLRELGGDTGSYREAKMVEDSESELSELESSVVGMEVEEEWQRKCCGRPNFKRATSGAGQQQSTQDFFRCGGNDIFDTPEKSAMGGALTLSLTAAASSSQEVEMAETLNSAKSFGEGVGKLDVGVVDWAEAVANEVEMEGVVDSERSRTPSPTPARWGSTAPAAPKGGTTPTPVLVTPTKGSKRMAMGTPRPNRLRRPVLARLAPIGFAAASALEEILAAVARVEKKMEEKVAVLETWMMEGIGSLAAEENEREVRMAAGLLADAEQREKRLAVKLLTIDGIETELTQKGQWEIEQWKDLARLLEARRRDIGEVKRAMDNLADKVAEEGWAHWGAHLVPTEGPSLTTAPVAPQPMAGVAATLAQANEMEQGDSMEGVEWEGPFASQHAPQLGAAVPTQGMAPGPSKKKGKEKEKGKAVQIAIQPALVRAARQARRQTTVNEARAGRAEMPVPPIRSILNRPETEEVEKKAEETTKQEVAKKQEEKMAAMKKWEAGELSQKEGETYSRAARPIQALAGETNTLGEVAAGQRIAHIAGMRALESRWEEEWDCARAAPLQQQQQSQQRQLLCSPQQQQQRQQRQVQPRAPQQQQQQQQQTSWAQRAAVAAALPQADNKRRGQNGKAEWEPTGLERIKHSIPRDKRGIVFARAAGAPQIDTVVAASAAAFVNIALSRVAPAHVRTEAFRITLQGRLSTTARFGASAAILLCFKKEILEAARKADRTIINVIANETWAELKILVPYDRYRHPSGLADLREQIEAENPGVVVPPLSMKWMRSVSTIERHYQAGRLPKNLASVVFKVPGKVAAQKLLVKMWVAGNKFRALPYIPDKADTLCHMCGQWGHSEFRCQRATATCAICTGTHRTEEHWCEVAACGKVGKVCPHTEMKCPNCGGGHPTRDARCRTKRAAIEIIRGRRASTLHPAVAWGIGQPARLSAAPSTGGPALLNWVPGGAHVETSPDWTEDPMEVTVTGMEPSGTVRPIAV